MYRIILSLLVLFYSFNSFAQYDASDEIPKYFVEPVVKKPFGEIIPKIKKELGETIVNNIENSEAVYYYEVANIPKGYRGYTLNNFAIRSFGGIITDELKPSLTQLLFGDSKAYSEYSSDCNISPKVMFRFLRGVDYVDVLMSYPCPAIVVYYAGEVKIYNMEPYTELFEKFSKEMTTGTRPFISPVLLNQTIPVGVPRTLAEEEIVRKANQATPKTNWQRDEQPKKEETKKKAWGAAGVI